MTLGALLQHALPEAAVGRHAAADGDFPDTGFLGGADEFTHENVNKGFLETGAQILLVLFQEIRIQGHLVPDKIQERSFYARETVVQSRDIGFGKLEPLRIPLLSQPVNHRPARIAQAQHFGTFVEGLPNGIVNGLAQDVVGQRAVHPHNLGIAAGNQQAQVRERWLPHGHAFLPYKTGQDVPLQMIDHHHGNVQGKGKRLGEGCPHQERAQQSRAAGKGNGREFLRRHAGLPQRLRYHGDDVLLMRPRRQFRHHAAKVLVHLL